MDGETTEVFKQASKSLGEVNNSLTKCILYISDPAIKAVVSEDVYRSLLLGFQNISNGIGLCIENIPAQFNSADPDPPSED